ncbi:tetratricopeptide repeat protein [Geomesophilobacter sediminis]|uniref:Tetratricopeptide repeat protein n=1 Tax=Geomesophilobacter sediminis TaxID=2798584 RepID=A0A8J7M0G1_9BACT|nr:tetratricopeptide repeat protein [Geomesophilobacter sediminis]MBJ6725007.1 tetratricopeptide repeat protein [Geomesophilobacter sediminis]
MSTSTPQAPEQTLSPAQLIALGLNHHQSGRFAEAKETYLKVLATEPENFDALHLLGVLALQVGKLEIAVELIEKAVKQNPANAVAFNNLGEAYKGQKRYDQAERCYRLALELKADFVEVYSNLGNALKDQGRLADAVEVYRKALAIKPDFVLVHYNLGNVLKELCEFEDAEAAFTEVLTLKPDHADAAVNLAVLQLLRGDYPEGKAFFAHSFEAFRDSSVTRWRAVYQALQGKRRWQGEPLEGKRLLLVDEPGAGDNIMMLRYLPLLRKMGPERITLYATPHLGRLVQAMECVDEIVPMTQPVPLQGFDFFAPMMSLPAAAGTTLDTVPREVPYLRVPGEIMVQAESQLAGLTGVRVGLVWGVGRLSPTYQRRSIPLDQFGPLRDVAEVQLVSLQKGKDADQRSEIGWDIFDCMADCRDFLDTAGLIDQLDLVISVDTSVAHLAGALGKPVWLLNCFESEWRWMLEREDSPWYPTLRIFRQKSRGDWAGVIEEVVEELGKFVKKKKAAGPTV